MNQSIVAVLDAKAAGAVIWWTLSGSVIHANLEKALKKRNLDLRLPNPISPETALHRAVTTQTQKHRLVRRLGRGWAIVEEREQEDNLEYKTEIFVALNCVGKLEFKGERNKIIDEIESRFTLELDMLDVSDISRLLVDALAKLQGLCLRERGGMYFVPAASLSTWRKIASAIKESSAGSRIYEIPALRSDEAVEAILGSLQEEVMSEATDIESRLDKLGVVGLKTRQTKCKELIAKVSTYEEVLGTNLTLLNDRISTLKAAIATALLKADGEEEY